ncbi:MAG: hypothetical protein HZB16_12750 [Armatimonadetes bacterium]|nr:hypothetical protein [Armatimonadota bacterium]
MSTDKLVCKACGCHLEHSDVRQLAVYYRSVDASLVAVQYVCPRCGATEWQRYQAEDWAAMSEVASDLPSPSELREALEDSPDEVVGAVPPGPITVDEVIDFGLRIRALAPGDLAELRAGLA